MVIFGFAPQLPEKRYPFFVSAGKAISRTIFLIKIVYAGLWKLVTGQVSFKLIGGPIMIVQLAGQEAQMGMNNLLMLVAVISVNLAVLNFLPIPVLDGGHIAFLLIEGMTGKPLSKKKQEIAQQIGIAIIIGLMVLATYNDIFRFLEK
jgi:regulator of sigma E protease